MILSCNRIKERFPILPPPSKSSIPLPLRVKPILICLFIPVLSLSAARAGGDQLLNLAGIPREERNILPKEFTWPDRPGEAALCLWKDDKEAVISYTIDDNCARNIDWWLKESAERGDMKVTWFLVSDGIEKKLNPSMNADWTRWQTVRDAGHGLESHTMTHLGGSRNMETWKGIDWEYETSRDTINAGLGAGHKVSSLAYPGGNYPGKNDPKVAAKYYASARGTKGMLNGPQGINYLQVAATTKPNFGERPTQDFINAENLFNPGHKAYRGWKVIIYHYIKESDPAAVGKVRANLDYAVEHGDKLWVGRYGDVARYAQSRETANLEVVQNSPSRIALRLTDRMDDRIYDFPLTVKVRLPASWQTAQAEQDGKPAVTRLVEHDGNRYALVDIIPDRGNAVLTP